MSRPVRKPRSCADAIMASDRPTSVGNCICERILRPPILARASHSWFGCAPIGAAQEDKHDSAPNGPIRRSVILMPPRGGTPVLSTPYASSFGDGARGRRTTATQQHVPWPPVRSTAGTRRLRGQSRCRHSDGTAGLCAEWQCGAQCYVCNTLVGV
jgi:hypothetical protein